VAVPLASLPEWAQHVSLFFPGGYAVNALQACIAGWGLADVLSDVTALVLIGAAALLAGGWMFRWEPQQRFAARPKGGLAAVLAAWVVAGVLTEARVIPAGHTTAAELRMVELPGRAGAKSVENLPSWRFLSLASIVNHAEFEGLPPDSGIISPIARPGTDPPPEIAAQLAKVAGGLGSWPPAKVADPVQRVRNLLYVAAGADVLEMEVVEGYVPGIVLTQMRREFAKEDLIRLLYWISTHPDDGDDSAVRELRPLGIGVPPDMAVVRERVTMYSLKFLGRLIGRIPAE
jgi:hypothetical protein